LPESAPIRTILLPCIWNAAADENSARQLLEPDQEWHLCRIQFFRGFLNAKESSSVDFGNRNLLARVRWPFHLARVALDFGGIAITLESPCMNDLAGFLPN
jgi:hypothetical protein